MSPTGRALLAHRRLLLALAATGVLYRHRHLIASYVRRSAAAARHAAATADRLATLSHLVSADALAYLAPAASSQSQSSQASERPSSETSPATSTVLPPPRSLRRLLRIAASSDALVVLRAVAASFAREAFSSRPRALLSAAATDPSPSPVAAALEVLDTPAGARVARLLVTTAVREAVATFAEHSSREASRRPADESGKHWLDVLISAGLSERGRGTIVDVAAAVTRAAVPALVAAQSAQNSQAAAALVTRRGAGSASTTPLRKARPASMSNASSAGATAPSPASKQLMAAMMSLNAGAGANNWMERAAKLASRDRGLVRDVVRTVASEAIRAYLTTQAELQLGVKAPVTAASGTDLCVTPGSVSSPCVGLGATSPRLAGKTRVACQNSRGAVARAEVRLEQKKAPLDSLWKALARSFVEDARGFCQKAFHDYMAAPPVPRWFFF